ncbi:MAG: serine hydrolase [Phycisphaerales bacterium]|nr:serine hydrolase [Phycisphaerales bacterium]
MRISWMAIVGVLGLAVGAAGQPRGSDDAPTPAQGIEQRLIEFSNAAAITKDSRRALANPVPGWQLDRFARHRTEQMGPELQAVLDALPQRSRWAVDNAEEHRFQVVLGLIERNEFGLEHLRRQSFRAGAEYFYPASTKKLFAAIAALESINPHEMPRGRVIDPAPSSELVYMPIDDESRRYRPAPDQPFTIEHEIWKLFVVSDNTAFNRLYDLLGRDEINKRMRDSGLWSVRVTHRLAIPLPEEEQAIFPAIGTPSTHPRHGFPMLREIFPQRTGDPTPQTPRIEGLTAGDRYLQAGEMVEEPFDFTRRSSVRLDDLQRALVKVARPDLDDFGKPFAITARQRALLLMSMGAFPRESVDPVYDGPRHTDDFVKYLLPGLAKVRPAEEWRIYNKVGMAYGFLTENAYVVHIPTGKAFFLAATVYTNENRTLNDNTYEYQTKALPLMADLGEAAARLVLDGG